MTNHSTRGPAGAARPPSPGSTESWTDRVIPLPQRCIVRGSMRFAVQDARIVAQAMDEPAAQTALSRLRPLAQGDGDAPLTIALTLRDGPFCPRELCRDLARRPNADQAYSIRTLDQKGRPGGVLLAANAPLGLLYAARTLGQLAGVQGEAAVEVELPVCEIDDWPDLEERGLWGGNAAADLEWLAERKMNVVEAHASLSLGPDGAPRASMPDGLLAAGRRLGVRIVPIIMHLEQIECRALFERHPDLAAAPQPGSTPPTDHMPHMCMSHPVAQKIVTEWMRQLLALEGVTDVMVWLSEDAAPCFCGKCEGREPYGLEVQLCVAAWRAAGGPGRGGSLRLLTTQGSYPVNERVLAAAPADVKVSYYDGGRTYDSSRAPMIYPVMEKFAASGRWLGVYPQLTNSWRTVFPFTGPGFIHARMGEFVDKGLRCVIGYATPSDRYYEFNVTAAAEWGWNRAGRAQEDFCRAWAVRRGTADPAAFGRWAAAVGDVGWDLAACRFIESILFRPEGPSSPDWDWKGERLRASFPDRAALHAATGKVRNGARDAELAALPECRAETDCVLAALGLMAAAWDRTAGDDPASAMQGLSDAAADLERSVCAWGLAVNPADRDALPSRFIDTVDVAAWTASIALEHTPSVQDPRPELRWRRVGSWTADDLPAGGQAELAFDVTPHVHGPGPYGASLRFTGGFHGLTIHGVELRRDPAETVDAAVRRWHVGRYDRWTDYWLDVPQGAPPSGRWKLVVKVDGMPADAPPERRTCNGDVFFRRACR